MKSHASVHVDPPASVKACEILLQRMTKRKKMTMPTMKKQFASATQMSVQNARGDAKT